MEWTENDDNRGTFDINNGKKKGVLSPTAYIGGRSDISHYFNGYLEPAENVHFPNYLKKLIIKSQYVDEDDERVNKGAPPAKVLKVM